MTSPPPDSKLQELLWDELLQLARAAQSGQAQEEAVSIGVGDITIDLLPHRAEGPDGMWSCDRELGAEMRDMLDLYLPLCIGSKANAMVVAHLGQSLDGKIATEGGVSQFITGEANLVHTHRMRALFDAVIVGAHTAHHDDPRLTTRLASGENATRVLIDPRCTVDTSSKLFTDGETPTLVLCDQAYIPPTSTQHLGLPAREGKLACREILDALAKRGLRRIFIEGGGVTVSEFLRAGLLQRLHVCVAPMIIGSGRPSFSLPAVEDLEHSVFFDVRHHRSGADILFDCQLSSKRRGDS